MKDIIIDLYINGELLPKEIAERVKLSEEQVITLLKENFYYPCKRRNYIKRVLNLREAVLYYLSHKESATAVAHKFNLHPTNFCLMLKYFGYTAINEQNRTKFDETLFDVIDTEEKAYWLGFIFADGTIAEHTEGKKPRYQFELCTAEKDIEHLQKFNSFMKYEGNNIKIGQVKLNGNIYTRARWIINNRHLWETLYSKGCIPNKSLVLKFPDIPQELKRHFIRGYFDGDGSVGIYNGKLSMSCLGTLDMLDNILKDFNWTLKYHHDKRHTDKTYSFQLVSDKTLEFLDYIYKDSSIYLERKYLIYKICRASK